MPHPFIFSCPSPGCGRTYRARPEYFGKTMTCQGCHEKIRIPTHPPTPTRRVSEGPAPISTRRVSEGPPKITRRVSDGTSQPDPPLHRPIGASPPIPQFVPDTTPVQPVFDETDPGYEIVNDNDSLPSAPPPPVGWTAPEAKTTFEAPLRRKKKKKEQNSLKFLEDIVDSPKLLFLFGSVVAFVLIVFGIMFAPLALGMRLIGYLFTLIGFVYAVRITFDESPTCGILYFLDCTSIYRLYYTVTRWAEMKHAFFAEVFGLLLCVPWVVLTTEDFMNKVPVNLNDFNGRGIVEPDDEEDPLPGEFDMPFDARHNGSPGPCAPFFTDPPLFTDHPVGPSIPLFVIPASCARTRPRAESHG